MNEVLDFFVRHWQLSSLFFVLLMTYAFFELYLSSDKLGISPEIVVSLYNHKQAVVLDIRSKQDFALEHIVGSINITTEDLLDAKNKKMTKYKKKPVIIICSEGKKSAKFVKLLQGQNFKQLVYLSGGINSWKKAGLPLTSKG